MVGVSGRAVALVAILVLAGCVGDADPDGVLDNEADVVLDEAAGNGTLVANMTFPGTPVAATIWANGSAGTVATCVSTCGLNVTDISAVVPHEVPVFVRAEMRMEEPHPYSDFNVLLTIDTGDDARFYRAGSDGSGDGHWIRWEWFARGTDAVEVRVSSYDPGITGSGDYSLEIRVVADPSVVVPEAPAAFDAERGASYEFRPAGPAPMDAIVYGPDDAPVARVNGTEPVRFIPETSGEHVIFAQSGSVNLSVVRVNATAAAALRPVGVASVISEFHPLVGPTAATWTFDASVAPTRIRLQVLSVLPAQAEPTMEHVLVESPADVVVDEVIGCDTPCAVAGLAGWLIESEPGDPDLVPGTYTVTVTPGVAETGVTNHIVYHLDRAR